MSMIKRYFENEIERLSHETGYSYLFLVDIWNDCMNEGDDWEYFKTVTLEKDW